MGADSSVLAHSPFVGKEEFGKWDARTLAGAAARARSIASHPDFQRVPDREVGVFEARSLLFRRKEFWE